MTQHGHGHHIPLLKGVRCCPDLGHWQALSGPLSVLKSPFQLFIFQKNTFFFFLSPLGGGGKPTSSTRSPRWCSQLLHPSPDGERGLCRERETTSWAVRTFRHLSAGSCDAAGPFPGGIMAAFSLEEKKLTRCKTPRQLLPSGWRSQDLKPEVFRAL